MYTVLGHLAWVYMYLEVSMTHFYRYLIWPYLIWYLA